MNRETLVHWLIQRGTAAVLFPTIFISTSTTYLILFNIVLFWHLHIGIEEILTDYIHHELTRNFILIFLRVLILIIMKLAFVLCVL